MNRLIKNFIKYFVSIVNILFLLWIGISWVDVVLHNLGSCEYLSWNFFSLFF